MTEIEIQTEPIDRTPSWTVVGIVEILALVLLIGGGFAAWGVGIVTRGHDYDEVLRAHSIWLTTQGLRPYSDFFEVHPPYFILLSPVVRAFSDPVHALIALRVVTAIGNLVFLGGLVALGARSLPAGAGRRWAWLGVATVVFNPFILDYLVEFRVDGWGYAAIVWSTFLYVQRGSWGNRNIEFGVLTGLASALLAPKMVLLPPMIVLVDLLTKSRTWRGFFREGLAYAAGVGLAAGLFVVYLLANRIGIERLLLLLVRYHAVSNAHASFRYGLLGQVLSLRPLLSLVLAGLMAWAIGCLHRRVLTGPFEPALALWLAAQTLLVSYPYKQYYAPWFLFASAFVPSLGPVFNRLRGARVIVYLLACAVTIHGSYQIAKFWADTGIGRSENDLIRWMNRMARPEDRVVGSPPYHPIDRFDTFFLSFNTSDRKGFDSERILAELPGLQPFVMEAHYRSELEAHPPAFVVLQSPVFEVTHPATQKAVLEAFIQRKGYRITRVGVVWFAIRPDRYEHARRTGDVE